MRFQTFLEEVKNNPDCFGRSLSSEVSILPIQESAYDKDTRPNIVLQPLESLNPALAPHRGVCYTSDLCSAHHRGQTRLKTEHEENADLLWSRQDEAAHPCTRWVPAVSTSCTALPLLSL